MIEYGRAETVKWKELTKYFGLFVFAVAVIAVYKTFDNIGNILSFFGNVLSLLSPFVTGFVIAYVFLTPCKAIENFLMKRKLPFLVRYRRVISVTVVYLLFVAAIVLILVAIIPALTSSLVEFYNNLPALISDFAHWFNSLDLGLNIGDGILRQLFDNDFFSLDRLLSILSFDNVNRYAQGVMNVGSGLFNILMAVVISIYILSDRTNMKREVVRFSKVIFKERTLGFVLKYLRRVNEYANKYIYCMLVDAIIICVAAFIILSVEGVQYAPLLAIMLGAFNLIPYFGAIAATVIVGIITAFTGSFTLAIIAVVSMIVLQQLDSNLIQPKLFSGSLQVKPFWVIFGILLGGGLFGIIGIFLAVPITAFFRSILIDIMDYREAKLSGEAVGGENDTPE